jgi:coenzyme PQQ synthesis protein D (PqqD)
MPELNPGTIVVASREQVSSDLAGETVLLSMKTAHYYGLADVGARIWSLVQEPVSVAAICDTIASEYDVSPERCQADVLRFLQELAQHGLVEVDGGGSR